MSIHCSTCTCDQLDWRRRLGAKRQPVGKWWHALCPERSLALHNRDQLGPSWPAMNYEYAADPADKCRVCLRLAERGECESQRVQAELRNAGYTAHKPTHP
jgi:hypothetical protein